MITLMWGLSAENDGKQFFRMAFTQLLWNGQLFRFVSAASVTEISFSVPLSLFIHLKLSIVALELFMLPLFSSSWNIQPKHPKWNYSWNNIPFDMPFSHNIYLNSCPCNACMSKHTIRGTFHLNYKAEIMLRRDYECLLQHQCLSPWQLAITSESKWIFSLWFLLDLNKCVPEPLFRIHSFQQRAM